MDPYARMLSVTNPLREPMMFRAIKALRLPIASRGLDVGCGIGLQALQLAEAVGPGGHVTGLDSSEGFLALAREMATQSGLAERVKFRPGDWGKLPFEEAVFDWIWSADGAGYAPGEPVQVIRELARVVKPGGTVAILFWSSQMLLPGYPALEARLNATRAGLAPFDPSTPPELHPLRLLGGMRAAGLENCRVETLVYEAFAPLDEVTRNALAALIEMRWSAAQPEVSEEDWTAYRRLCEPASQEFILKRPDYYGFFTYSLFSGTVR